MLNFLKKSIVAIVLLNLLGCVSTRGVATCSGDFYSNQTPEREDYQSTIYLCLEGETAFTQVYYPNTRIQSGPTICRSRGSVAYESTTSFVIDSRKGMCKNRNFLRPSKYACEIKNDSMLCKNLERENIIEFTKLLYSEAEN